MTALANPLVAAAVALVVGLCVGSFLNVVVHRLPKMMERDWRAQCAELRDEPPPEENPPIYNLAVPRSACPECGRLPGPNLVLVGWHPCGCGGHATTYCRTDTGGCGHTRYEPELVPQRCTDPPFGFSG